MPTAPPVLCPVAAKPTALSKAKPSRPPVRTIGEPRASTAGTFVAATGAN